MIRNQREKNFKETGITLVALVVTVIVLLILAGVTLFFVLGENGVITRAGNARYMQAKATIEQEIEQGRGYAETYRQTNTGNYLEKLADFLNDDQVLKSISGNGTARATNNGDYVLLIVGEEFNYQITETTTTFLGNKDEAESLLVPDVIELNSSNIEFSYSKTTPTKAPVGVTITLKEDALALQQGHSEQITLKYKIGNDGNWEDYTGTFNVSENCVIYPALYNGKEYSQTSATGEVSNIDKTSPQNVGWLEVIDATDTSITVTYTAKDETGIKYFDFNTSDPILSIPTYYPSENRQTITSPTAGDTSITFTYKNLNPSTSYRLTAKASDEAGNYTTSTTCYSTDDTRHALTKVDNVSIESISDLSTMYGLTTDYQSAGVDWQLFYDDDDNYYLIASNCVPIDRLPQEIVVWGRNGKEMTLASRGNGFYYSGTIIDTLPWSDASSSASVQNNPYLRWVGSSFDNKSRKNYNMRVVAFLMDTSKWSNFAVGQEDASAIGGPLLEMFLMSYNAVSSHTTKLGTFWDDDGTLNLNSGNATEYGYMLQNPSGFSNGNMWNPEYDGTHSGFFLASPGGSLESKIIACRWSRRWTDWKKRR